MVAHRAPQLTCEFLSRETFARSMLAGDGAREAGALPCFHRYSSRPVSSRPINMRRISAVPAPIVYSFASRTSRPAGTSLR
jgi:hypothetical protein